MPLPLSLPPRARLRVVFAAAVFCCAVLTSGAASAQVNWKRVGTVSTLTNGQLCKTDGTNVICDSTTPSISASNFVGIGSTAPVVSLDDSQNPDAIALPGGSNAQRPTGAALVNGEIRYNNTGTGTVEAYYNGAWNSLVTSATAGTSTPAAGSTGYVQYNSGGSLGASSNFFWDATNNRIGLGTTSPGDTLTVNGTVGYMLGSDYTTTGSQNNVSLGAASAVRYNGAGAATFTGIAAGANGQILYLHNPSAYTLTLANLSGSSSAANQIVTGTGAALPVPSNTSVTLQYDATASLWRVTGSSNSATSLPAGSNTQVQFNNSGAFGANSNFVWDNTNGRVGIGTASPTSMLEVNGTAKFDNGLTEVGTITATGSSTTYYSFNALNSYQTYGYSIQNNNTTTSYLQYLAGVTNGIGHTFTSGGNTLAVMGITTANGVGVGIGTTSFGAGLDVQAAQTAASGNAYGIREQQTLTAAANNDALNAVYINPTFADNSKTGVTHNGLIVVSGNVGIGTTLPSSSLQVAGTITDTGEAVTGNATISGKVGIGSTSPGVSLDISQKTDALALPGGSSANRPTAVNGMIRYNSGTPGLESYYGSAWNSLLSTASAGSSIPAAGSSGQMQYNNGGVLGGAAGVSYASSGNNVTMQSQHTGDVALTVMGTGASSLLNGVAYYWNFDEDTGTTLNDATGNGNTGTFQGTAGSQWGAGKINYGLSFDGSSNYVSTAKSITEPSTFSISAWFKTGTASGKKIIGFESAQTGTGSIQTDSLIYVGTDGKLYFGCCWSGSLQTIHSSSTVTNNAWHHAIVTYNSGNITLYLDNTSQATMNATNQGFGGYWRIGSYTSGGGANATNGYFPGLIDEVGIWNRALTSGEVSTLYNSGSGMQYPFTANTSSQTGNLVNIQSNLGATIANIDASGDIATTGNVTASGTVAVGTASIPTGVTANVNGVVKVSGTGSEPCTASQVGAIRYNPSGNYFELCSYP